MKFEFEKYAGKKGQLLKQSFYSDSDILNQAKSLLGKVLVTNFDGQLTSGVIVDTEAYRAPEDKGSHAFGNRLTERTKVMFEEGGRAYVYLCYGIHEMFNVVGGPKGAAHAILVRAIEPLEGLDTMIARRQLKSWKYNLTAGPGSLAKALGINRGQTGLPLTKDNQIWIESRNVSIEDAQVLSTPRIGIDYAEEWKDAPWRFILKHNPWISGNRKQNEVVTR